MSANPLLHDPFCARATAHRGRLVFWEGHEVVELESPELRLAISATRGAEILSLLHKPTDSELLWRGHEDIFRNRAAAPNKAAVDGNFIDQFSGGWQEILPNAQFAVEYEGAVLGAHGEVALLPWDHRVVEDRAEIVAVEFRVRLRRVPLTLRRTVTLQHARIRMDEQLSNVSKLPIRYQWGHHISLSGDALVAGTRLVIPGDPPVTVPADPSATYRYAAGTSRWPEARAANGRPAGTATLPPDDGTEGHLILGPMTKGLVSLTNPAGLTVDVEWDEATFPYCWMWQVFGGHLRWPLWGRHRVVTVEPFTSPLISLPDEIEAGTAPRLAPGDTVATWVQLSVSRTEKGRLE